MARATGLLPCWLVGPDQAQDVYRRLDAQERGSALYFSIEGERMTSSNAQGKPLGQATGTTRLALNALEWYMTVDGYRPDLAPALPEIYRQIRTSGFQAVPIDPPDSMTLAAYRTLLSDADLAPAPGYFSAPFSVASERLAIVERARQTAGQHAELGLDRLFIADHFADAARLAAPGQGAGHDPARLAVLIDNLRFAAEAMVEEGVRPCLHQHVGTLIETPGEVESVLGEIGPELLLFGPDTGHLAWAGADVAAIIRRHAGRIGAVHLKDLHMAVAEAGRRAGEDYWQTCGHHLWTEPGRGDLRFDEVLEALAGVEGWFVVEVDVADQPTPLESARVSWQWCERYLRGR
jgi:inosose dehydratase